MTYYYVSMQYSAIQKTVLRHDRLWSMSGISQMLSRLNEIALPEIAEKEKKGIVIVAGGGKFTARFDQKEDAEKCIQEMKKAASTSFPMLEYQITRAPVAAESLLDANDNHLLVYNMKKQKQAFRGYGVSYNPHLIICDECREYPAVMHSGKGPKNYCAFCRDAKETARLNMDRIQKKSYDVEKEMKGEEKTNELTTMEKIYRVYLDKTGWDVEVPLDFKNLFGILSRDEKDQEEKKPDTRKETAKEEEKNPMAVWFSDINNMKDKVTLWLGEDEDKIRKTFLRVRAGFIRITAQALIDTFPSKTWAKPKTDNDQENRKPFLPFRIVIAGGDDLCIVMDARYILQFCLKLSQKLHETIHSLGKKHPLNLEWLEEIYRQRKTEIEDENANKKEIRTLPEAPPGPYCFGGSFLVVPNNVRFQAVHAIGEELMKTAKKETDRMDNAVNWRIMAEEEALTEKLLQFERPVFIEPGNTTKALSFREYQGLCEEFMEISQSQRAQIISRMMCFDPETPDFDNWLKAHAAREVDTGIDKLLKEKSLHTGNDIKKPVLPKRIATLFELMSLYQGEPGEKEDNHA